MAENAKMPLMISMIFFEFRLRTKHSRAAHINEQHQCLLPLFLKHLDKRLSSGAR
jgi:hypothetical protein